MIFWEMHGAGELLIWNSFCLYQLSWCARNGFFIYL